MPYQVLATPTFEKDYVRLSAETAARVAEKIDFLAEHPEEMHFPLKHLPDPLKGLHKYRIGDYRLLFRPNHERQEIVLYAVAHRSEIYRRLGRT